jgi:hypothetical protein
MKVALVVGAVWVGAACGGPALQNAPHPNNAMMAGGFAAAAAAATLASPADAAKKAESNKGPPAEKQPVEVKENVPAGVFDRLDQKGAAGSGSGSGSARDDDDGTRGAPTLTPPPKR